MSNDKIDFDFTIEDLDRMVIEAASGDGGEVENKAKTARPNLLEMLRTEGKLGANTRKQA